MEEIKQQVNSIRGVSRKKILQKKGVVVFFLLLFILLGIVAGKLYIEKKVYSSINTIWRKEIPYDKTHRNDIHYEKFKTGLFRYTNDGISYYEKGELIYTVGHNIKEIIIKKNENYFLVAERNGNNIYIYDEEGLIRRRDIEGSIKKVLITDDNRLYICVLQNENYVMGEYDINLKYEREIFSSNYMTNGLPLDIDIDRSGKKMVVGFAYKSLDKFSSRVMIYDIDKDIRTIRNFTEEFSGMYIGRVIFYDKKVLIVTDVGLFYITIDEEISIKNIELNNKICSISYNDKYFSFIIKSNWDETNDFIYKIVVYDSDGKKISESVINYEYSFFNLVDDFIFIRSDDELIMYDIKGNIRLKKESNDNILYIHKEESLLGKRFIVGEVASVKMVEVR